MRNWLFALAILPHPGTVAFDYRNSPDWASVADFESVVLSPRAQVAADSLESRGVRVLHWYQPFASRWNGVPVRDRLWDKGLWGMLDTKGGVARYANDDTVFINIDDVNDAVLIDFGRPGIPEAWASLVYAMGRPALLDYGCESLEWAVPGLSTDFWRSWSIGWGQAKSMLSALCQCHRWQPACNGVVLEKVGWGLQPYAKAWDILRMHPGTSTVLAMTEAQEGRRLMAAMALATDSGFNWGFASTEINRRDPEHFSIYTGKFYDPVWEREPGIWQRIGTHGMLLINFSARPYTYSKWTLKPNEALVTQFRNKTTGRYATWKTTLGE